MIPTGKKRKVSKTPFDFNKPKQVGNEINDNAQASLAFFLIM
jgi:hypothetical protein